MGRADQVVQIVNRRAGLEQSLAIVLDVEGLGLFTVDFCTIVATEVEPFGQRIDRGGVA